MLILAALWGFAEATLFVIVADVPISVITARAGLRAGLAAALVAALAAALGGLLLYVWAARDGAGAHGAVAALPGIDAAMIARVGERFRSGGYGAMLAGAFSGVPYKIYALLAGERGLAVLPFVLLSPIIRLPRFVLTALVTHGAARLAGARLGLRGRYRLLAVFWTLFYAGYFAVMP